MAYKEYNKDFVPSYVNEIAKSQNPEFRTCEVLTRIDNLIKGKDQRLLESKEKIKMLRSLRKGLEMELTEHYLINRKQHDSSKNIFILIDRKISDYSVHQDIKIPVSKIYDVNRRRKNG